MPHISSRTESSQDNSTIVAIIEFRMANTYDHRRQSFGQQARATTAQAQASVRMLDGPNGHSYTQRRAHFRQTVVRFLVGKKFTTTKSSDRCFLVLVLPGIPVDAVLGHDILLHVLWGKGKAGPGQKLRSAGVRERDAKGPVHPSRELISRTKRKDNTTKRRRHGGAS